MIHYQSFWANVALIEVTLQLALFDRQQSGSSTDFPSLNVICRLLPINHLGLITTVPQSNVFVVVGYRRDLFDYLPQPKKDRPRNYGRSNLE